MKPIISEVQIEETSKEGRIALYKKAVEKWGVEPQITMCIEECAELIVALAKRDRAHNGANKYEIAGEIADVELCIESLKEVLMPMVDEVAFEKEHKLDRLRQRLNTISVISKRKRIPQDV